MTVPVLEALSLWAAVMFGAWTGAGLPATAPAGAGPTPIQPSNKPVPVPGDTNGAMPARDLVSVAPGCEAYRPAAPSLALILATAREQGVDLSTEECYRPLSDQVAVKQTWTQAGNSACAAPVVTAPSGGPPKGTSNHGWGEAVDFHQSSGPFQFGTAGYRFVKANAGRFGWNHPGWAEPGGGPCPEAWHWEWVGDGGVLHASPVRADVVGLLPAAGGFGYSTLTGLGGVADRGYVGAGCGPPPAPVGSVVVGGARTPDGRGCWLATADGGVLTSGDAAFAGSAAGRPLNGPVVGVAAGPAGRGYLLATSGGQVLAFGGADGAGPPRPGALGRPVVGIAASPDGRGYWLVTSDARVLAAGGARPPGPPPAVTAPIVGIAADPRGGWWLAAADGSVYPGGGAPALGSAAGTPLPEPVVGVAATPDGGGYWLVTADGRVLGFGDALFLGDG